MEDETDTKRRAAPKPESTKHLRVLSNGAVYDMAKKRIVSNPGGGTTAITKQNASAMAERRKELKAERLAAGANRVAEQGGSVDGHEFTGDMAFVEAIGEAMAMKALTPNDPKAVDAARFLFTEIGIAEKQDKQQQAGPAQADDIIRALGQFAEQVLKAADVIPIRQEITVVEADE